VAIGFWSLDAPCDQTAVIADDGRRLSYADLSCGADRFGESISSSRKTFGFVLCRNTPECLMAYLGSLRSGNAVCLLDADIHPELLGQLLETYKPDWIFAPDETPIPGYRHCEVRGGFLYGPTTGGSEISIDHELALLLPTSGSTGSPKLVRLAYRNLQANARSIVEYLAMTAEESCITSLPMSYSYGLSVVNSHLLTGGRLCMTRGSFLQREFWTFLKQFQPTSLAGVPYHYDVMLRMRMLEQDLPGLRTLTQAGGRLAPENIGRVENIASKRGYRFFVMYGQTEATARIAYVPSEQLRHKIGSIGIAIPGGSLSIDPEAQELVYTGPNVMLGYADNREDLAKQDELQGRLRTGDLAIQDQDGYFYLTGRIKRFLKVFGKRFNLDEMETLINRHANQVVACFGVDDKVCVGVEASANEQAVARVMTDILSIHPTAFRIVKLQALPRLANGKLDYPSLAKVAGL
jgi:long-chain acyl-CoA synthetase